MEVYSRGGGLPLGKEREVLGRMRKKQVIVIAARTHWPAIVQSRRMEEPDSEMEAVKRHGDRLRRGDKVSRRTRIPVRQSGQRVGGGDAGTVAESSATGAVMEGVVADAGISACRARLRRERQAGLKMP